MAPTQPEYPQYRTQGFPTDVVVNSDSSLKTGWLAYLEPGHIPFQGYYTCSTTHPAYARIWIAQDLTNNKYNSRFIDVELASSLTECFSNTHPTTRGEDAQGRKTLLYVVKNEFSLVTGSEEARDYAFPVVDFGEGTMSIAPATNAGYDWSTPVDTPGINFINYNMNPARRIPLHGLVYHDTHVVTWYTGDGVSKVPAYWDDKDLFNILYASMPLVMPHNYMHWFVNRERFITSVNLVTAASRSCGFAKMTNHQFLNTEKSLQKTIFDNGWQSVVNFGTNDISYEGNVLPSKGFYASNGSSFVYRIKSGNSIFSAASLSDRLFINPAGSSFELKGVRTLGATLLQKFNDYLSLVFIGSQNYVDINLSQVPWQMSNIVIRGRYRNEIVSSQNLGNGWLRINKQNGECFYKIEGNFIAEIKEAKEENKFVNKLMQNFPNPVIKDSYSEGSTKLSFTLKYSSEVKLIIYDMLGREVKTLVNKNQPEGKHSVNWDLKNNAGGFVSSGIYLAKLSTLNFSEVIKIQVIR